MAYLYYFSSHISPTVFNCVIATDVSNQYGVLPPLAKEGNCYIGHNDALRLSLPYLINTSITGFPSQHLPWRVPRLALGNRFRQKIATHSYVHGREVYVQTCWKQKAGLCSLSRPTGIVGECFVGHTKAPLIFVLISETTCRVWGPSHSQSMCLFHLKFCKSYLQEIWTSHSSLSAFNVSQSRVHNIWRKWYSLFLVLFINAVPSSWKKSEIVHSL